MNSVWANPETGEEWKYLAGSGNTKGYFYNKAGTSSWELPFAAAWDVSSDSKISAADVGSDSDTSEDFDADEEAENNFTLSDAKTVTQGERVLPTLTEQVWPDPKTGEKWKYVAGTGNTKGYFYNGAGESSWEVPFAAAWDTDASFDSKISTADVEASFPPPFTITERKALVTPEERNLLSLLAEKVAGDARDAVFGVMNVALIRLLSSQSLQETPGDDIRRILPKSFLHNNEQMVIEMIGLKNGFHTNKEIVTVEDWLKCIIYFLKLESKADSDRQNIVTGNFSSRKMANKMDKIMRDLIGTGSSPSTTYKDKAAQRFMAQVLNEVLAYGVGDPEEMKKKSMASIDMTWKVGRLAPLDLKRINNRINAVSVRVNRANEVARALPLPVDMAESKARLDGMQRVASDMSSTLAAVHLANQSMDHSAYKAEIAQYCKEQEDPCKDAPCSKVVAACNEQGEKMNSGKRKDEPISWKGLQKKFKNYN
jgi:hypothetical protein